MLPIPEDDQPQFNADGESLTPLPVDYPLKAKSGYRRFIVRRYWPFPVMAILLVAVIGLALNHISIVTPPAPIDPCRAYGDCPRPTPEPTPLPKPVAQNGEWDGVIVCPADPQAPRPLDAICQVPPEIFPVAFIVTFLTLAMFFNNAMKHLLQYDSPDRFR